MPQLTNCRTETETRNIDKSASSGHPRDKSRVSKNVSIGNRRQDSDQRTALAVVRSAVA